MEACKDYICGYASQFVKNRWGEIDKALLNIEQDKEDFARLVRDEFEIAAWVITEVMRWGTDKDYLEEMKVQDNENGFVAQFGEDTYIEFEIITNDGGIFDHFDVKFVGPKTKTVIYFE